MSDGPRRRARPFVLRDLPALAVLLVLSTCGPAPAGPTWVALTDASLAPRRSGTPRVPEGSTLAPTEDGLRIETRLAPEAFTATGDGRWTARQPVLPVGRAGSRPLYELTFPGEPELVVAQGPPRTEAWRDEADGAAEEPDASGAAGEPRFRVADGRLELSLPGREELPGPCVLSVSTQQQALENERFRISGRRVGGEGLCVWPGEAIEVTCDVPSNAVLRFACAKEAARLGQGVRIQEHVFRVLLEGALLFEETIRGGYETVAWRSVVLPAGGARDVTLRFEVEGPASYTSFLAPVIAPTEVGSYAARPWERERRDVVVFLADTFRADNLAAYGSDGTRAPALDAFAEEALVFTKAWSVSTHTLPTHSSLFSGLYPRQVGQVDFFNPLPRVVDTLGELLTRYGYRTVAITDGIMVSQTHGMAQGFGWFDERRTDLDGTLERVRAALEADDGRPLFLFVQSYASHAPFQLRDATRAALGPEYDPGATFDELTGRLVQVSSDTQRIDVDADGTEEALDGLARMYAAAVRDLDRGFDQLLTLMREHELLDAGHLLVTSDHGESLGEHARVFHGGVPFEEVLRVPLLVAGPSVTPGRVDTPVSLIDFTPTVAALAGVPVAPQWLGRSLLEDPGGRPIFAFQCRGDSVDTTVALIYDERKLIGYEDRPGQQVASWWRAFDLGADPREERDLLEAAEWPSELGEAWREAFADYLTPRVDVEASNLSEDSLRALDDMGYGGGE